MMSNFLQELFKMAEKIREASLLILTFCQGFSNSNLLIYIDRSEEGL